MVLCWQLLMSVTQLTQPMLLLIVGTLLQLLLLPLSLRFEFLASVVSQATKVTAHTLVLTNGQTMAKP